MRAKVRYNDDGKRTGIEVNADRDVGMTAQFSLVDDTAVLTSVRPTGNRVEIYGDGIHFLLDSVTSIPGVDDAKLDEFEEPER